MPNAWVVRPKPHHIDRMKEFLDRSIVAIGWIRLGPLDNKKERLESQICVKYPEKNSIARGNTLGQLDRFLNSMKVNDIVVTPDGKDIYVGIIKSDYYYEENCEKYSHQRKVQWVNKGCPYHRKSLPTSIQKR